MNPKMLAGRLNIDNHHFEVRQVPVPLPGPGEVRVRVERLNLDAASFRQLEGAHGGDGDGVAHRGDVVRVQLLQPLELRQKVVHLVCVAVDFCFRKGEAGEGADLFDVIGSQGHLPVL